MTDTVLLTIDGPRASHHSMNDPAKHNRLDTAGLGKLREAIEKADAEPGVRSTVLTGPARRPSARVTTWARSRRARTPGHRPKPQGQFRDGDGPPSRPSRMPTLCALNGGVYGGATDMRWLRTSAWA